MSTFIHSNRSKGSNPLNNTLGGLNNLPGSSTMEPISMLSTIGAVGAVTSGVCKLAFDLYEFVKSTQNVNEAVTGLVEEVNALKSILETVKQELDEAVNLPKMLTNSDNKQLLWGNIQVSLKDCKATIDKLEKSVVDVGPESSTFAIQAVRRIKLNLMDNEITNFRTQIRTHINALQMGLQMVNLRAAWLAPNVVTGDLGPKIDKLYKFMELVHGCEADVRTKSLGIEPQHLTRLRISAQKIISDATTVGVNSEAARSDFGEGIDEERRDELLEWIQMPTIHKELDDSGSHSVPGTGDGTSNATEEESDTDLDIEFEEVKGFFTVGIEEFDQKNYPEAQSYLQQGVQLAEKLTLKRRQLVKLADIKLKIATCFYHSPNLKEAEVRLRAIAHERIHEYETKEGAIRRCDASHLLAGVLLRQGRYSDALEFCRQSVTGRWRVLGKDHLDSYESVSLMSQIFEANGQYQHAKVYWKMIPADVASKLVKVKDEFPEIEQKPSAPFDASEAYRTTPPTGDSTTRSYSPSGTQSGVSVIDADTISTNKPNRLALSPTSSSRSSKQETPPSSLERASTAVPNSLPLVATSIPIITGRSPSMLSTLSVPGDVSPRKPSRKGIFRRRRTSGPSATKSTPSEGSISEEVGRQSSSSSAFVRTPPFKEINNSGDSGEAHKSFMDFIHQLKEEDNTKDDDVLWPGLQ